MSEGRKKKGVLVGLRGVDPKVCGLKNFAFFEKLK